MTKLIIMKGIKQTVTTKEAEKKIIETPLIERQKNNTTYDGIDIVVNQVKEKKKKCTKSFLRWCEFNSLVRV